MDLLRIYADISSELDTAMRVHCAKQGITRKKFLEEIICKELIAKGAIARSKQNLRHSKKG